MSRSTPRAVAYLTFALACFTDAGSAEAGVGGLAGAALSSFADLSPVQMVQAGECWEQNGPDGPGYYPCGDGGGGGVVGPAFRRHQRHGALVNPQPRNPVYPAAPARGLDASGGAQSPGLRGVGAPGSAGVARTLPGLQRGAAPVSPGLAGVHTPGEAAGAHVAAPALPAPASPGVAGVAAPHIAAPASPGPVGVGAIHAGGAVGVPRIAAPASPGLAGVHGVGGGGIGHR